MSQQQQQQREQVPGVPVGAKLVRIGAPKIGEFYLWSIGSISLCDAANEIELKFDSKAIIAPDNVYGLIDLGKLPIPKGWHHKNDWHHRNDWFRVPALSLCRDMASEFYVEPFSCAVKQIDESFSLDNDARRVIVERDEPKTQRVLVVEYSWPYRDDADLYHRNIRNLLDNSAWLSVKVEERPL